MAAREQGPMAVQEQGDVSCKMWRCSADPCHILFPIHSHIGDVQTYCSWRLPSDKVQVRAQSDIAHNIPNHTIECSLEDSSRGAVVDVLQGSHCQTTEEAQTW